MELYLLEQNIHFQSNDLIPYPEIDDASFKGALRTFKQWVALKLECVMYCSLINVLAQGISGIRSNIKIRIEHLHMCQKQKKNIHFRGKLSFSF